MDGSTLDMLGLAIQVIAVCNIGSALPASFTLWKTGNTEGWPTLFFIIGLCGGLGMLGYGILADNFTVKLTCGLTVAANIYYILTFFILADKKSTEFGYLTVAALYLAALAGGYMSYDPSQMEERKKLIGSASTIVFSLMNASTVLDVVDSVQKKTIAFDLTMLAFGMANSGLWVIYGYILNDFFLYGPNLPFLVTGVMKILLLTIYPMSKSKKTKAE